MTPKVLVLGASGELGSVIAQILAADGCRLVLHGFQSESRLAKLADEVHPCAITRGDVRNEDDVNRIIADANEEGTISGLVYAVGVNPSATRIGDTPLGVWRDTLDTNLTGAFQCVRAALPTLRAQRPASAIVLVSSIFGLSAPAHRGAYSVSKHGLTGLVQCVAKEEGINVRINGVCPGPMWTENVRRIFARHAVSVGISVEEYVKERTSRIPAGRFLALDECAAIVAFLLSDKAAFLTGEMIKVAGGES